jgi:hypothetical protein
MFTAKVAAAKNTRYRWQSFENEAIKDFFRNEINDVTDEGNKGSFIGGKFTSSILDYYCLSWLGLGSKNLCNELSQ